MSNNSLNQSPDHFVRYTGFFFRPITLPAGWDDLRDQEFASSTWGMNPEDAWAEIFNRLPNAYREICEFLDSGFRFLAFGTDISPLFDPESLPLAEKLDALESLVGGLSSRRIADRERVLLAFQACRHVDQERGRILRNFMTSDEGEDWAFPLVVLVDTLVTVRMYLKEAFNMEVEGFAAPELREGNQI